MCTFDRIRLLGEVRNGEAILNAAGRIVHAAWLDLPAHHPHVVLDAWIVMPDHVHGIIVLTDGAPRAGAIDVVAVVDVGAGSEPAPAIDATTAPAVAGAGFEPAPTMVFGNGMPDVAFDDGATSHLMRPRRHALSEIVRGFKTFSARRINTLQGTPGRPVWRRNYFEHVIRSAGSLRRIRAYIEDNPAAWMTRQTVPHPPSNRR